MHSSRVRWLLLGLTLLTAPVPTRAAEPDPFAPPTYERAEGVPKPPWRARGRSRRDRVKPSGWGLMGGHLYRVEPKAPAPGEIDLDRLAKALPELCGWMPPKRPPLYAKWLVEHGAAFGVDPFLLGGIMYATSRCRPRADNPWGVGLMGLYAPMHLDHIKQRRYRYHVLEDGRWVARTRDLSAHLFYDKAFEHAEPSIYFAAGLMSVFEEQHASLRRAFPSIPYRHAVSHYLFGDRVRGGGAEEAVLTARRRLLDYYNEARPPVAGAFEGLTLTLPLDGAPRTITSVFGDDRSGGARLHKGVDFLSDEGEPVRAVADGKVTFAGVDLKGAPSQNLSPAEAAKVDPARLGGGGLMVMVRHEGGLTSAYMHLVDFTVTQGQEVEAGDLLGHVGRTGIRHSPPHLHFELRHEGKHLDPLPLLGAGEAVVVPMATWKGLRLMYDQRRERKLR